MEKCLLVRGHKKDASWGFPRGKLAAGETDQACAVREVWEETGLDISGRLVDSEYIDVQLGQQDTRLFIIQASAAAARASALAGARAAHPSPLARRDMRGHMPAGSAGRLALPCPTPRGAGRG